MGIAGVRLRLPREPSKLENRKSETQDGPPQKAVPTKAKTYQGIRAIMPVRISMAAARATMTAQVSSEK